MIKKQVDWDIRVQPFTDGGGDPRPFLKNTYPAADGWELLSTTPAMVSAGGISIVFTFAKYEYIADPFPYGAPVTTNDFTYPVGTTEGEAPRRRGRPPKVAEEVAG